MGQVASMPGEPAPGNEAVDMSQNPLLAGAAAAFRSINPISSAQAAPAEPTQTQGQQGEQRTAEDLIANTANSPVTGSEVSGQESEMVRQARALLRQTEVRPGVYAPQADQLGAPQPEQP